jgi:hypothetical protein
MSVYEGLTREQLIAACLRKDDRIAALDQAVLRHETQRDLALSEATHLRKQIRRLWRLAERDERETRGRAS